MDCLDVEIFEDYVCTNRAESNLHSFKKYYNKKIFN